MNNPLSTLPEMELKVATLLCKGHSREEIAAILDRSVNTVHTHCRSIFRRFNVRNVGSLRRKMDDENIQ